MNKSMTRCSFIVSFRLRRFKISRNNKFNYNIYIKGTRFMVDKNQNGEIIVKGIKYFNADREKFQLSSKDTFNKDSIVGLCYNSVIVEAN